MKMKGMYNSNTQLNIIVIIYKIKLIIYKCTNNVLKTKVIEAIENCSIYD